ncbi:MAG: LytTR family transcriptional regulator DNA-binding domain-containing protein [Bacteroidales bacterium]|nr:LytTR family transcriptional regulator DNA-binding domain-containing protein [Bacteroidales bacterium]
MSTILKTLIIEDEQPAIDLLNFYLKDNKQIEIIEVCKDGFTGLKAINELKPDLVFLDIQMPKLTGFELIELLEHQPMIVFTTAYDEFALKAFEVSAIDYLLKPFSTERLQQAIQKVVDHFQSSDSKVPDYQKLSEYNVSKPNEPLSRIVVKTGHQIKLIPVEEIFYLEAQDDYVMIYTKETRYIKQATMKYFEMGLDAGRFVRIHRSYIANIDEIKQLEPYEKESYLAILKNGAKLKISKTGFKNLKEKLDF